MSRRLLPLLACLAFCAPARGQTSPPPPTLLTVNPTNDYQDMPPPWWVGPWTPEQGDDEGYPEVGFDALSGSQGSGSASGPMGTVTVANGNLSNTSPSLSKYFVPFDVAVSFDCNPGWHWNSITGFVCVIATPLSGGTPLVVYQGPFQAFSTGFTGWVWESGPLLAPKGYVITTAVCAAGIGYTQAPWTAGLPYPCVWRTPPVVAIGIEP